MRHSVLGNIILALVSLPENFLGAVFDLVEKLAGKNGSEWFEAFKKFLRKENPWITTPREWKIWKTIRLGTGLKTAEQFCKALEVYGFKVSGHAKDLMAQADLVVASLETEVDLVVVSVDELGFKYGALLKQIYARALELGLSPCPAEVGPQLRLQYKEQPEGEWLRVAMEPIMSSDNYLRLFEVGRSSSGLWLNGYPSSVWHEAHRLVFVRRLPTGQAGK